MSELSTEIPQPQRPIFITRLTVLISMFSVNKTSRRGCARIVERFYTGKSGEVESRWFREQKNARQSDNSLNIPYRHVSRTLTNSTVSRATVTRRGRVDRKNRELTSFLFFFESSFRTMQLRIKNITIPTVRARVFTTSMTCAINTQLKSFAVEGASWREEYENTGVCSDKSD